MVNRGCEIVRRYEEVLKVVSEESLEVWVRGGKEVVLGFRNGQIKLQMREYDTGEY